MFPIPGFLAKVVQKVQETRMKKTDARVQVVSEAMNVLRMIKMFGWERRIEARLTEKREDELIWYRRERMAEICLGILGSVSC